MDDYPEPEAVEGSEWNSSAAQGMLGCPTPASEAERMKMRAQQAVYMLAQARLIRADAPLMAAIRAYVREQRDELAVLLDDLGD